METWAFCRPCDRWYYCPEQVIEALASSTCPVCRAPASTFQQRPRAEHPVIAAD